MYKQLKSKTIIGTWSLSGDYGHVNKLEIYKTLEYAIKNNFFEFDISPIYGKGKIENILSNVVRGIDKILINTKCGYNNNFVKTFHPHDITRSIQNSIEKFGKLNIVFLHNPRNEIKNWNKVIELLLEFKKIKLIKYIGLSVARDFYFEKKILDSFDYIQDDINLLRTKPLLKLSSTKSKIIARSPLASGVLSGKLSLMTKFKKNDNRRNWLRSQRLKNILEQIYQIKKIEKNDLRTFAINFLFTIKKIDKIIFGVKNQKQLENLKLNIKNFKTVKKNQANKVFELNRNNFYLNNYSQGY
jgi:aryl-alcohol dehydrogenase-like predicted oxidoreductase|tara:strand:- start:951 stop:1850 length:900 start_codon:yes stop_codon:yes gene_type:complete